MSIANCQLSIVNEVRGESYAFTVLSWLLGTAVWQLIRMQQKRVMLPDKQAILDAAQIETFSWRATTFEFRNQAFLERFKTINESSLMES